MHIGMASCEIVAQGTSVRWGGRNAVMDIQGPKMEAQKQPPFSTRGMLLVLLFMDPQGLIYQKEDQ